MPETVVESHPFRKVHEKGWATRHFSPRALRLEVLDHRSRFRSTRYHEELYSIIEKMGFLPGFSS